MNYLQLCQRTARECGVSGSGPASVLNQVGELSRIVAWVATAHMDIETAHTDWGWMKRDVSFITVAGQAEYAAEGGAGTCGITAGTFGVWSGTKYRFRNYNTVDGNIGEIEMGWVTYDVWRDIYSYGATRYVQTRPMDVAFAPDQTTLCLGPYPAVGYTVTGQYYRAPLALAADADTPEYPVQFHMMVVYKAMMYYGMYEAAPEVYNRGEMEFAKMMARLDAMRLPEMAFV